MIRRPRPQMRLTRREVFVRDRYTCQYCGKQTRDLTIDHVVPRHAVAATPGRTSSPPAGPATTARPGDSPTEAHMSLLGGAAQAAGVVATTSSTTTWKSQEDWRKFIPGWEQYEGVAAS